MPQQSFPNVHERSPPAAGGRAAPEEGPAGVDNGWGFAEAALRNIIEIAFGELWLHRIQVETRRSWSGDSSAQRAETR